VVVSRVLRLDDLPALTRTDAAAFTPPPRFGDVDLAGYRPHHPSQALAKERVRAFAAACTDVAAPRPWWRLGGRRGGVPTAAGLYLDGGFGVGKTHLLAAAYALAPTRAKRYVSFQQLVHVIGVLGMAKARQRLAEVRLLCLDEFELDDPGNTLIVKTFLAHAFAGGGAVITTSNTAPEAQGLGRFDAEDFRREIQSIAAHFDVVRVDGPDARAAQAVGRLLPAAALPAGGPALVRAGWSGLLAHLRRHHPARYRAQLEMIGGLAVDGARPLPDQNDALRLVHFVDTLYDLRVPLWLAGAEGPSDGGLLCELFDPSYRDGAYATKYRRCASRLAEVLSEARALHQASDRARARSLTASGSR
jgi:cell division protein ZapE